jgi:hypothetical protein
MRNGPELGTNMMFENLDCEIRDGTNARGVVNAGVSPTCSGCLGVDRNDWNYYMSSKCQEV